MEDHYGDKEMTPSYPEQEEDVDWGLDYDMDD